MIDSVMSGERWHSKNGENKKLLIGGFDLASSRRIFTGYLDDFISEVAVSSATRCYAATDMTHKAIHLDFWALRKTVLRSSGCRSRKCWFE